jgi:hypothetical protein
MNGNRHPYLGGGGIVGTPKGRDHLKDSGTDERMILKCILKIGCEGMDFIRLFRDTPLELVGLIKRREFLDCLKTYSLLVEECAPWTFEVASVRRTYSVNFLYVLIH